jgi:hypothetical protein
MGKKTCLAKGAFTGAFAILAATSAVAEDQGTMHLAPSGAIAVAMSDQELGKQRGGYLGIVFSLEATIEILNGAATGSTTTSSSGLTTTTPPINYNITGGQVALSTYVGNLGNLNGVFQINAVNGFGNIVYNTLNLNVAVINMGAGYTLPSLTTIFPQ